jgi:hypothetical protein
MNTAATPYGFDLQNESIHDKITSRNLANGSDTDADMLEQLANHEDFYVRRAEAR